MFGQNFEILNHNKTETKRVNTERESKTFEI